MCVCADRDVSAPQFPVPFQDGGRGVGLAEPVSVSGRIHLKTFPFCDHITQDLINYITVVSHRVIDIIFPVRDIADDVIHMGKGIPVLHGLQI